MKQLARGLRKRSTDAERLLWQHLRDRQLSGFKFRRQVVIEPYIVDFVCFDAKLIVEADGGQHAELVCEDAERSTYLQARGYKVLRFWNNEILGNIEGVLEVILEELIRSPHPSPLPGGEGAVRGND